MFSVVLIGYASDAVLVPNRGVGELDLKAAWVAAVVVRGEGCRDLVVVVVVVVVGGGGGDCGGDCGGDDEGGGEVG